MGFLDGRERSSGDDPGPFGDRGSALWRSRTVHDGTYRVAMSFWSSLGALTARPVLEAAM